MRRLSPVSYTHLDVYKRQVRRYLEYKGYDVNYVSNFTDVDDKIIKKANEEGVSAEEISTRYIAECLSLIHILRLFYRRRG